MPSATAVLRPVRARPAIVRPGRQGTYASTGVTHEVIRLVGTAERDPSRGSLLVPGFLGAAMAIICTGIRRELTAHHRRVPAVLIAVALTIGVLAGCSSPSPVNTQGARILRLTIVSRFVRGAMPLTLVTPAGGGPHRPLLVFLHGLGYNNNSQLTDQMFAALHALGPRAPDIAFPYGGSSAWVTSASAWASYVLDEVIPKAVKVLHADPRRVAIGGISNGGLAAYAIASLDPGRFCAVGGHSAAIYPGPLGAFGNPKRYGDAQLWLDVGAQDPSFIAGDEQLARALHVHLHMWPGGHDFGYWNAHWSDYLGFYAHALATCR
jgi:predicted esterase